VVQWTLCKGLPKNVSSVAAGQEFSLAASPDGGLYSCGSEENGQCGSGRTGEHIESSKVGFGVLSTFTKVNSQDLGRETITAVTAGAQHGACLTQSGVAFTWGAGGYGRLGHRSTADELRPKRVQGVADCRIITAGTTCTYFVCGQGEGTQLLLCGILKKTGDSNM
jgi:alpha-tubulin suppressor-like RCC1 family protein